MKRPGFAAESRSRRRGLALWNRLRAPVHTFKACLTNLWTSPRRILTRASLLLSSLGLSRTPRHDLDLSREAPRPLPALPLAGSGRSWPALRQSASGPGPAFDFLEDSSLQLRAGPLASNRAMSASSNGRTSCSLQDPAPPADLEKQPEEQKQPQDSPNQEAAEAGAKSQGVEECSTMVTSAALKLEGAYAEEASAAGVMVSGAVEATQKEGTKNAVAGSDVLEGLEKLRTEPDSIQTLGGPGAAEASRKETEGQEGVPVPYWRSRPVFKETAVCELAPGCSLVLHRGDITQWAVDGKSDAIVNAANERMLGGGGVDGAIHRAAGPELLELCKERPVVRRGVRCPTGLAVTTGAARLPVKFVIHTVGPLYDAVDNPAALLSSAYRSSVEQAIGHGVKYLAFPAISCGIYGYPLAEAAEVASQTLKVSSEGLQEVHFVLFGEPEMRAWRMAAANLTASSLVKPQNQEKKHI